MTSTSSTRVVRWVARIWSLASIAFVSLFLFGNEGLSGGGPGPTATEWVGLALFPLGVCVGLIIGWLREGLGGAIAVGCLIAFYFWLRIMHGAFPRGPYFLLVAMPGILFIISWFLSNRHSRNAVGGNPTCKL